MIKNKINIVGIILFFLGIICFIIRLFMPTTVESDGTLVDHFYLVGTGYLVIFIGIVIIIVGAIIYLVKKNK